jgi:predicted nucleotidyltransferase
VADREQAVREVVATIRDEYHPEKIILFGSCARDASDDESDLDILIIKQSRKRELDRIRDVYRIVDRFQRRPYRLPLDILVKTPAEIRRRLAAGDDFLREILQHGRVLYERVAV